jgi:hypothetical protein
MSDVISINRFAGRVCYMGVVVVVSIGVLLALLAVDGGTGAGLSPTTNQTQAARGISPIREPQAARGISPIRPVANGQWHAPTSGAVANGNWHFPNQGLVANGTWHGPSLA